MGIRAFDKTPFSHAGVSGWQCLVLGHWATVWPSANDEAYGRYFYDRYRRDLRLSGPAQSGDRLRLEEGAPWQDGPKANWSLTRGQDGTWTGTWTGTWSGGGKSLPLALEPLHLEQPAADARYRQKLRQDDPYEFRRLQGLTLEQAARNCDEPGGTLIPYAEVRKHPGPLVGLLPR